MKGNTGSYDEAGVQLHADHGRALAESVGKAGQREREIAKRTATSPMMPPPRKGQPLMPPPVERSRR